MAHDLRAPVASIQSILDVLLQGYASADRSMHDQLLRLARDRAAALLSMVNDLLSLGSMQQEQGNSEVGPVQVVDVLWQVLPELRIKATLRGVELILDAADAPPTIRATEHSISQLLCNLIDNAIKYSDPGDSVRICLTEGQGFVTGTVEDEGIGIAPEDMDLIFEDFYRATNAKNVEPYGPGLGLPIVKRVVDTYEGQLQVDSELDRGSKFSFSFPSLA